MNFKRGIEPKAILDVGRYSYDNLSEEHKDFLKVIEDSYVNDKYTAADIFQGKLTKLKIIKYWVDYLADNEGKLLESSWTGSDHYWNPKWEKRRFRDYMLLREGNQPLDQIEFGIHILSYFSKIDISADILNQLVARYIIRMKEIEELKKIHADESLEPLDIRGYRDLYNPSSDDKPSKNMMSLYQIKQKEMNLRDLESILQKYSIKIPKPLPK